jgi:hypothetical protein
LKIKKVHAKNTKNQNKKTKENPALSFTNLLEILRPLRGNIYQNHFFSSSVEQQQQQLLDAIIRKMPKKMKLLATKNQL